MTQQRTCYYAVYRNGEGEKRVSFGLSRRREAQIETSLDTWEKISDLITGDGCRLVKVSANGTARGSKPTTN